jgi:hypothetical protein
MTNPGYHGVWYVLSTILAAVGCIYVIYYPIKIAMLIRNVDLRDEKAIKKYGGIWIEYKEKYYHTAAFEVVICIKKLLIAISLVFLGDHPTY